MTVESEEEREIVRKIEDAIGDGILETKITRSRRIFIYANRTAFKKTIRYLTQKMNFNHISTITGVDKGKTIEVIYHLNREGRIELSLKVQVPEDRPLLPTITDIIPGAILYEREVHELLGVTFEGHPDLSPLLLPEGWPQGVYPLRKNWTIKKIETKVWKEGKR